MIILLTSAKTMTGVSSFKAPSMTTPRFAKQASEIALQMAQFPVSELSHLLKLNPKLASETYLRFQEFHSKDKVELQAILAYTGVVFKNLNPKDFCDDDYCYMQDHLRIVSIAYGLLRPLDGIKPYRMEYDIKLPELSEGNMYPFWRLRQTKTLIDDVKKDDGILINLASHEVQPAFEWKKVNKSIRIITPEFKVWKNGKYVTIVIYTKMARGQMSRYILKNRITDPEDLKNFTWEAFAYNEHLSEGDNWVFTQDM